MTEQPKPATGYPAAGYPPYASTSNGYPPTGYAPPPYYPPPPPHQPNHSYYYGSSSSAGSQFLRRLIMGFIAVFLIMGTVFFIVWLIFRPQLPEFSVSAASVTRFNVSGSEFTGGWDVTLAAYNGNKKMGIAYQRVDATVLYHSESLADTSLAPLYQEKRSNTTLRAGFAAVSKYVPSDTAGMMASERNSGKVYFNIRLWAIVQFRSGGWRTRWRTMAIRCDGVEVDWPNLGGNSVSGRLNSPSGCSVYM